MAIKTFHEVGDREDFLKEAGVMQSLQNDYIVGLLGVCYTSPLMLVSSGVSDLDKKWGRLAPNGRYPGLFHIKYQYILAV